MYTLKCQSMFYKEGGDEERKCDITVPHQAANRGLHRWSCLRTQCKSTGCSTYMCHPAGSRRVVQRPTVVWTKTIIDTSSSALLSRNSPPRLARDRERSAYTTPPLTHAVFKYSVHADRYTHTCTAEITLWRFTCVAAALPQTGCRDPTATNTECNDLSRCCWLHNAYFWRHQTLQGFSSQFISLPFFFLLFAPTVPHARWSIGFSPKQNTFGRDELADLTLAWRLLLLPVCKQGEKQESLQNPVTRT